jgi:hypothetical protein
MRVFWSIPADPSASAEKPKSELIDKVCACHCRKGLAVRQSSFDRRQRAILLISLEFSPSGSKVAVGH